MTGDKPKVTITATIPKELLHEFLQHIRYFDTEHAGCHFELYAFGGDLTLKEMNGIMDQIDPPFPVRETHRKQ